MPPHLLKLVADVIKLSSREQPADAVLREELRAARGLSRADGAQVSRGVFAYFRWLGWLHQSQPLPKQVSLSLELSRRFANDPTSFPNDELLARVLPSWIHDEISITTDLVRALQAEPRLWLRARPGQGRGLAAELGSCEPFGGGPLADILEYRGNQDLFRTEAFQQGQFELQDISSQVVGLLCAPNSGETWWDACAGEGGKTLHLSDLMQNKGLIWATDRAQWRLQKLKRRAARARVFNFRTVLWDGSATLPTRTKFDGILVDAPCSGMGTWQRNPHARWTTSVNDVRELGVLQKELLANVAPATKPGGKLIYSVCTLTQSETVDVVEDFERRFPHFQRSDLCNPLMSQAPPVASFSLLPKESGGNGMFVAAWIRKP
jgi:16S rRNA (cytosine967-C5)-methyltransferase